MVRNPGIGLHTADNSVAADLLGWVRRDDRDCCASNIAKSLDRSRRFRTILSCLALTEMNASNGANDE